MSHSCYSFYRLPLALVLHIIWIFLAAKLLDFTLPYYSFGTAHNLDILGCKAAAHVLA
jgi:hypothetical protein